MKILSERERSAMRTQGTRDLLTAGWLGEQMFAQLGLHRAVSVLDDPGDRTRVIARSWRVERPYHMAVALGLAGVSLAQIVRDRQRRSLLRRDAGPAAALDVAASACALGAVASSLGCAIAGRVVSHAMPDARTPIATGFAPVAATPRSARAAQKVLRVLAPIGMGLALSSLGLSIAARQAT